MTPLPTVLTPDTAFRQFFAEEVTIHEGFTLAKSTLHEAYTTWCLEVPGRPALSPKHVGMLTHKLAPGSSSTLCSRLVTLWVGGALRNCRPFVWQGLRLNYPRADDPFELAYAEDLAKAAAVEDFTEEELAYRKAHGLD
jgi:hypothetical protein